MATLNESVGVMDRSGGFTAFIDRWIYVGMATFFIATVLTGFIPDSLAKIDAIEAGTRAPFPLVLHIHAVLMGSWLSLLLAQSVLMATGARRGHMQLGLASFILAPLMVVTGFLLVPTMFGLNWEGLNAVPPGVDDAGVATGRNFLRSLVAAQIGTGVMFAILASVGLSLRRRDPETHKRLMVLASSVPLGAAIDRIAWMPTTYPESVVSPVLFTAAWILPMLAWDLYRLRRLQRAYAIWAAVFVPVMSLVIWLWWRPDWMGFSQRLMGY